MITIENAQIRFTNFAGAPDKFNRQGGKRSFAVFLEPGLAEELRKDGWNVKQLRPREEDELPQDYMQVKLVYGQRPPKIAIVNPNGSQTQLDEETVGLLDTAELVNVDLVIRPYDWVIDGKQGRTAYVKSLYATLAETELDRRYRERAEAAMTQEGLF